MKDKQRSTSQVEDKHTPGPWEVDEFGYINASGQQIADVYVYDSKDCMDCGQCERHSVRNEPKLPYQANARLMAAAPELLKALKEMYHACLVMERPQLYKALANTRELFEKIEGNE